MEKAIREFPKQFLYDPKIENSEQWRRYDSYILAGIGGSHLHGDIFQTVAPGFNLSVHQDYGLPLWPLEILRKTLTIASSYTGNTEEPLSVFEEAIEKKVPAAAISTGGKLLELAKKYSVPYIQIPDTGIQPRVALGFTFKALAKMVGREDLMNEAGKLAHFLKAEDVEGEGKRLAVMLYNKVPIFYASNKNYSISYIWKIKCNETGKIPAFCNVLPELSHNEMNGFDIVDSTRSLSEKFHFIFFKDANDHPKIQKLMDILEKLYRERGLPVYILNLNGTTTLERVFSSLLLGDWVSYYVAQQYGVEAEQVPMVEEVKRLVADT